MQRVEGGVPEFFRNDHWNHQYPSVWVKDGGGGDFLGVWSPGSFAQLAGAYSARHGVGAADLKRAMAHVSWKSHQNAVSNPRAHLRKAVGIETILKAPMIADVPVTSAPTLPAVLASFRSQIVAS